MRSQKGKKWSGRFCRRESAWNKKVLLSFIYLTLTSFALFYLLYLVLYVLWRVQKAKFLHFYYTVRVL